MSSQVTRWLSSLKIKKNKRIKKKVFFTENCCKSVANIFISRFRNSVKSWLTPALKEGELKPESAPTCSEILDLLKDLTYKSLPVSFLYYFPFKTPGSQITFLNQIQWLLFWVPAIQIQIIRALKNPDNVHCWTFLPVEHVEQNYLWNFEAPSPHPHPPPLTTEVRPSITWKSQDFGWRLN